MKKSEGRKLRRQNYFRRKKQCCRGRSKINAWRQAHGKSPIVFVTEV